MKWVERSWLLWGIVGSVALGSRMGWGLWSGRLWMPEVWEYNAIAKNLIEGRGFEYDYYGTVYRSFCEPLYPVISAAIYWAIGYHHWVLVLTQVILSSLVAGLACQLTRWVTDCPIVALVAGLLIALHPGLILYSSKLHPLFLDSFLFIAVVSCIVYYGKRPSASNALAIGITTGLCFLTRPTILVIFPLIMLWSWWVKQEQFRYLTLILVTAIAIGGSWTARNYSVHGIFMLMRSTTSFVFWLGNNPDSTGAAVDAEGRDIYFEVAPAAFRDSIQSTRDELVQNQIFSDTAREYVLADIPGFFKRVAQKYWTFWWFPSNAGVSYPVNWMTWYKIWWFGLLVSGVWGLWQACVMRSTALVPFIFLLAMVMVVGLAQSIYYVEGRHRLVLEPLLSGLFAFGIVDIAKRLRSQMAGYVRRS